MNDSTGKADVVNQFTGEKWYYTDIVKDHFFNPRNLQLEDLIPENFDAFGMVGSPACIVPTTLIQGNSHLRPMQEMRTGEKVLGGDGRFHPIARIFRPRHSASLMRLKNQIGELIATPDHLIFGLSVSRSKRSPFVHTADKKRIPPSWMHAASFKKGDTALYPIPKEVRRLSEIEIPQEPRKQWDFKSTYLPRKIRIAEDLLELFGYFVAEGHTKGDKEVGFTFGLQEDAYVADVCSALKKYFGLNASVRRIPRTHRINIAVYNIFLVKLFRGWFGDSARRKHIPEFILFLEPELQKAFLRGLWRGDGYFSGRRVQPRAGFATISETLLHQMLWLLLRQKIVPSIYREPAEKKGGVSHQPVCRIHVGDRASLQRLAEVLELSFRPDPEKRHAVESWFDKNYCYLPVRRVSKTSFAGRLSNFEVGTAHTYATDAFLVHNCGDMMSMGLKVEPATERIQEMKWKTFGCASAIAATSMFSVMVTENGGMVISDALKIKPQDIMARLGGLPNRKIHCSVLADKAFHKAANDYFRRSEQYERIVTEGAKIVDPKLNITDKDIEEAVLEGAMDLEGVQKKLKVGVGSPEIITEVEQLIRFYKEKYYG
ncbi:MAG: iron-sulfur cluster assembly scaffold protein [Candidatus Sungiibacteriota bacterium]